VKFGADKKKLFKNLG